MIIKILSGVIPMKEKLSPFFVLFAAILWGTTGTAQAFAPESAHPIAIGAIRLAIGGLSLLVVALLLGQLTLKKWPVRPTVLAALCMAFYQPLFFSAVHMTGVAIGTVIAIGSAPMISGALEWFVWRKRPIRVWWYATFLSIFGCLLLFVNKTSININPYGILMALGAGLSFAGYTMVSGKLVRENSSLSVVAVVFTLSAIFLAPLLFIFDISWVLELNGAVVSLHLGLVATGAAYLLFAGGLRYVPSSTAVSLSLAEPLTASLLGVFLVGERLDLISWLGIALLIVGIGLLMAFSGQGDRSTAPLASPD